MTRKTVRALLQSYLGKRSPFSTTASRHRGQELAKPKPGVIGFVGLGNMGLPMCQNLASQGHDVIAYDVNDQAIVNGSRRADSLERVGAESEGTIVLMLPGCLAVHSVMPTILASLTTQTVVLDCSTVSPSTSRYWHGELAKKQHTWIDAPVSGGVKGAQDASLTFMVGCDSPTLDVARPILESMGRKVISCGGPGTGAATKLCNNLALATQMIGVCEALNLGEELGVDPNTLSAVLNTSTAKCWSSEINNPHPKVSMSTVGTTKTPAGKNYDGGFATSLMLKDLGLSVASATELGVALPLGSQCKELYQLATLRGLGSKDFSVLLQVLRGEM